MDSVSLNLLDNTTIRIAGAVKESIVDGPGIRYVVFTQGCPFHCKGCHNVQAQSLTGPPASSAVPPCLRKNPQCA